MKGLASAYVAVAHCLMAIMPPAIRAPKNIPTSRMNRMIASMKRLFKMGRKGCLGFLKPMWAVSRSALRTLPLHKLPPSLLTFPRPEGFHATTADYLLSATFHPEDRSSIVYPAETLDRPRPECASGSLPQKFEECLHAEIPAASVHVLHGVRFWGYYGGSIIGKDNRLLGDVSPDVWRLQRHKALGCLCLPPLSKLGGTVAVIATAEADSNYWHWMMETIPRVHLLEKAGYPPEKIDWYLTNAKMSRFQKETLAALRIPKEKIVKVDARTHILLEHAVVPSIWEPSWNVPSWLPGVLRDLPLAQVESPVACERLFLSRAGESKRQLTCERDLVPELEKRGFVVFRCGDYSVAEQKAVFSQARLIVAPHGAALSNIVFCRPGTVVLELMSAASPAPFYWTLATAVGLDYKVMIDGSPENGEKRDCDILLESEAVVSVVDVVAKMLT